MKLLIGYDGSDCAEAALDDLARAGLPQSVEAMVLTVAEVWLPPPSAYEMVGQAAQIPDDPRYAKARSKTEEALQHGRQAQDRLKSNFPDWQVTAETSTGSPSWELIAKADQWKPHLVVVGSHGRSALGRLLLGSVAQRVVTEAHCSVRVARGRVEEPGTPIRIVVGLDGSPGSDTTVREIARRTWPAGTEIRLVVANDPLTPTFVGELIPGLSNVIKESNEEDLKWIETLLDKSTSILQSSGAAISTEVREGDPRKVLIQAAEDWNADCIFVGSTGFSNRIERFVIGSVSAAVVARAHCSVEVVR